MPASDDLALLTEAARAAGQIALSYWRQSPKTWDKGGGAGPVTEADLAVNRMLEAELRAARPDYGWLSEETPDSDLRLNDERLFIIDPIDGTRAFIDGTPDFAHSLAVAEKGWVTAAVVYLPAQDRLYSAGIDTVSTLNGRPISASAADRPEGATLLTTRPNLAPEHWQGGNVPPVRRMFRSSIAWRLCLVAEGAFDAMLTLKPTWEWDAAAGTLIAAQAGALVTDRRGAPLRFNCAPPRLDGCLAAAPGLHRALAGQLLR
ncbi:3'(2'),5'-bisphosphate nucleotidase CysQ [Frigidibacter sp. SD6-1]|uniref:inositol monophosphatase family protein n=1 Tax=Frigidibacter sp. SD6-1 TaxID=3032581 RepID=UPI0024E03CD5|nr:3'(2'),5'-bisphosphate nucleotidase CysQ [Frigidibacter sp. SD6-1]